MPADIKPNYYNRGPDGKIQLTGTGVPGSTLQIVCQGQVVATVTVSSHGTWQTERLVLGDGQARVFQVVLNQMGGSGPEFKVEEAVTVRGT
jgi:hypothetical protein